MTQATLDVRRTILANPDFDPVEVSATPSSPHPASSGTGFLSRPHVLEAAARCFDELGYDKLTIRTIAGRLGCSVGSIYRYFTDKRELLLACCSQVLEPVADALESSPISFDESVALYLRQARAMNEQYRLMFWLCAQPLKLPVLERILSAWADMLGGTEEARRRWARLHGMLIIGDDDESIGHAVSGSMNPGQSPVAIAPPASQPRQAETIDHADIDAEDVTLL